MTDQAAGPTSFSPAYVRYALSLIFLVAVLEEDDWTKPNEVRNAVQQDLFARLLAYRSAGLSRDALVKNLRRDMSAVIDRTRGDDDIISWTQELRLTMDDILRARTGPWVPVTKTLWHEKGSAKYSTTYVLQPATIIIY